MFAGVLTTQDMSLLSDRHEDDERYDCGSGHMMNRAVQTSGHDPAGVNAMVGHPADGTATSGPVPRGGLAPSGRESEGISGRIVGL